jgi:hypothetical protein
MKQSFKSVWGEYWRFLRVSLLPALLASFLAVIAVLFCSSLVRYENVIVRTFFSSVKL